MSWKGAQIVPSQVRPTDRILHLGSGRWCEVVAVDRLRKMLTVRYDDGEEKTQGMIFFRKKHHPYQGKHADRGCWARKGRVTP